ncbi:MAG: hypothetical protein J07HX5_00022 [halophilic archaeon J07HX5]|nr:MAG: hypothetical protein J07HX5_00022 [halophilic archaeon J07HX5]
MSRQGADYRLRKLRDESTVLSKKIGASLVWFLPRFAGEETLDEQGDASSSVNPEPAAASTDSSGGEFDSDRLRGDPDITLSDYADIDAVVDRVADEWGDTGDRLNARKQAAKAVLERAHKTDTVSKEEAIEEIYPEYPVEGQSQRTWYRQNIRPVLNKAAEYDQSARVYRLTEELRE